MSTAIHAPEDESGRRPCPSPRGERAILAALALVHAALLAFSGWCHSPMGDEPAHLAAGLSHWELGRFDLYRVNPPLVRSLAALPVWLAGPQLDWSRFDAGLNARPEWEIGDAFLANNGHKAFLYLTWARWTLIPLGLLGLFVCHRWAKELYGEIAGLIAATLWCVSPTVLAWGSTIVPDMGAAALGVSAGHAFWRWLRQADWSRAFLAGLTLGLAELAKSTWIVLFLLWPALWVVCGRTMACGGRVRGLAQLGTILLVGLDVLNLGYGFRGSFRPLGEYRFVSRTLAAGDALVSGGPGGNRFAGTLLARLPVPLPEDYLRGIDSQKHDFELGGSGLGSPSFLNGQWRKGGWWYYYAYALLVKEPLGSWLLLLLAATLTLRERPGPPTLADEFVLLAPALTVFCLVSSQTGMNRYIRYVLPCLPFAFIWAGKVGRFCCRERRFLLGLLMVALAWTVVSSLSVYPHSISYFNELAGGPLGGHNHLVDANVDWGQDLFFLKDWWERHPQARPLNLTLFHAVKPEYVGLIGQDLAFSPESHSTDGYDRTPPIRRPPPGWYAISAHHLHAPNCGYTRYLLEARPADRIGYSIYIYHVK